MSLQLAAKHLAAQGRGPDDMLVHMSKDEVRALQKMARDNGGTLTINPKTGLPEAGFLSSLLPAIAGIGLTVMSGGALSPLAAGMIVGGGTTAMTGSLTKGLMAGLGAYGGAGLGSAMGSMGADAAASSVAGANSGVASGLESAASGALDAGAAGAVASPVASGSAMGSPLMDAAGANAKDVLLARGAEAAAAPTATMGAQAAGAGAAPYYANAQDVLLARGADPAFGQAMAGVPGSPLEAMKAGTQQMMQPGGLDALAKASGGMGNLAQNGLMAAAPMVSGMGEQPDMPQPERGNLRQYDYDPYTQKYSNLRITKLAGGGLSEVGERLMRGPGDGVSDSIPATIGGRQPAALADGEFVVPARVVSEVGNGSTEAGARKLYRWMDQVQSKRAKTARKGKVAMNSRADALLPT